MRVEANRLRKRLAEYYAGEGASHALQITIPVGQYVPRFEVQNAAESQSDLPSAENLHGGKPDDRHRELVDN